MTLIFKTLIFSTLILTVYSQNSVLDGLLNKTFSELSDECIVSNHCVCGHLIGLGIQNQINVAVNALNQVKQNMADTTQEILESLKKAGFVQNDEKAAPVDYEDYDESSVKFTSIAEDCSEVKMKGAKKSTLYYIQPKLANQKFIVWCDLETQGGGWTYILNRIDGLQNFYLGWDSYLAGFGKVKSEFWLGLQHIYEITNSKPTELLFELVRKNGEKVYVNYSKFLIDNAVNDFALKTLGEFDTSNENVKDDFRSHVGAKFSTSERDNDNDGSRNCADVNGGGFWYTNCFDISPTGTYYDAEMSPAEAEQGIHWRSWTSTTESLKEIRMMVRTI